MKIRTLAASFIALALLGSSVPAVIAAEPPTTWDDLTLAKSSRSERVYLLPSANFSAYSKVDARPDRGGVPQELGARL